MNRQLSGFHAWMWQRASAVYLAAYIVYVLAFLIISPPENHQALKAWIGDPDMWLASAVFFLALLLHAWVGIRDVILDYVHPSALRLGALAVILVFLLVCGLWVMRILVSIR